MTTAELQRIKDRIAKTICETWRGDHDGDGNMISVIEGRISADDFMKLFAEIDKMKTVLDSFGSIVWAYGPSALVRQYEDATGTKIDN